jgi:hypothetical protein
MSYEAVAQYVLGIITISVLATIALWIVLSILGVPHALAPGFVVGLFDLIPLVGRDARRDRRRFATVTVDFSTATIVWIAFIIVWQRFEDYVVQPVVYGRSLRVNPIVTIVSVLAGAALLGTRRAGGDPGGRGGPDPVEGPLRSPRPHIAGDRRRDRFGNALIWPLA